MKIEIPRHGLFLVAFFAGMTLSAAHAAAPEQITIDPSQLTTLAGDLRGTEGPSALPDGSVAILETMGGTVLQVRADGTRKVLTAPGSGVAGSAVGRDNALYVTKINLAGLMSRGGGPPGEAGPPPGAATATPSPAAVIRIDLKTGDVRNIYTAYQGNLLKEPNDLVVDKWGDLWFTDAADDGAVYWARPDGSDIKLMITDIKGVNGIAISPDQRSIYIAGNGKLLAYAISGRGKLQQANGHAAARELATLDPKLRPDGMKTEANGDILLACGAEGILRYSAKGELLSQIKFPGLSIVNLSFGGKDGRTLYLSDRVGAGMGGASQLQSITSRRPGVRSP